MLQCTYKPQINTAGSTALAGGCEEAKMTSFDDFQKMSRDNIDLALVSAGAVGKGLQALASEAADYSKQSFEAGTAAFEKLLAAGSLDKAVEVQSEYMRTAYEGYVGQVTKVGAIVADMAKSAYRPYESLFTRYGK
jgi:hypothetical protein